MDDKVIFQGLVSLADATRIMKFFNKPRKNGHLGLYYDLEDLGVSFGQYEKLYDVCYELEEAGKRVVRDRFSRRGVTPHKEYASDTVAYHLQIWKSANS